MTKEKDKNGGRDSSKLSTEERRIIKIKPGVVAENDAVKNFEAQEDQEVQKLIDTSQVRLHKQDAVEAPGTETDAKPGKRSHRLRTALLAILLLALGAFCMAYFGILDLVRFTPHSEWKPAPLVKLRVPRKPPLSPISEERPPANLPIPGTPLEEPTPSTTRETPVDQPITGSEQPEPMPSTAETAPEKIGPETASLNEPPPESPPPKWVEGVYPYSVNLGSFRTTERMQKAFTIYGNLGLSPYWSEVELGEKGIWFRLFTGFFKTRAEADAFIRENQIPDAFSRHTKYAVLIGAYSSEKEVDKRSLELRAMGYSSYEIKDINGANWLFTGAFYQMARAQKHQADLASKGIQGEVVER